LFKFSEGISNLWEGGNVFGLGVTEIIFIGAVALIFFGPSKLSQLGKSMGSALRNFRVALSKKEKRGEL
jgi:TatA/E family protein of Tat protein translocase